MLQAPLPPVFQSCPLQTILLDPNCIRAHSGTLGRKEPGGPALLLSLTSTSAPPSQMLRLLSLGLRSSVYSKPRAVTPRSSSSLVTPLIGYCARVERIELEVGKCTRRDRHHGLSLVLSPQY